MPTIHFIEGPAGSGKSYYIGQQMAAQPGTSVAVSLSVSSFFQQPGLRAMPKGSDDILYGTLLDSSRYLMALHQAIIGGFDHVYVDRFVISQFVYGYIRRGERSEPMKAFDATILPTELRGIVHEGFNFARYLNPRLLRYDLPEFALTFIVPDEQTVEYRRSIAERAFPFGMADYSYYSQIVDDPKLIASFNDRFCPTTVIRE